MNSTSTPTEGAKKRNVRVIRYGRDTARLGAYEVYIDSKRFARGSGLFLRAFGTPAQLAALTRLLRYILRAIRGAAQTAALKKAFRDYLNWKTLRTS